MLVIPLRFKAVLLLNYVIDSKRFYLQDDSVIFEEVEKYNLHVNSLSLNKVMHIWSD